MDFVIPDGYWVTLEENEKKDKYLDLARDMKKLWNMKVTFISIVIGALNTVTERLLCVGLGNKRTTGDNPNYYIIENGQNTEESPGDLLSLKL